MIGSHETMLRTQTQTQTQTASSFKCSSIKDTQSNQSVLCVKQNSGNNESIWSVVNSTLSSCSCQERTNDDNSAHHTSSLRLNNMIVRKQFRNQSSVTIRTTNLNYLMSINTSNWNIGLNRLNGLKVLNGPICYLMQFVGTCRKWWINSTKFTRARDEKSTSRLPYSESGANNRNHHNYKNYHKSSYFPTLSLNSILNMYQSLLALVLLISFIFRITEACSSRSTPKPRPPSPTTRPNITFQTYACPEAYAKWYCLNGATCFSVRIGESILYNCECADGYMGQRCEFKDLDGSYLRRPKDEYVKPNSSTLSSQSSREKVMVETASIAGGVTVAVLFMAFISIIYYTRLCLDRRRSGNKNTKCFQC